MGDTLVATAEAANAASTITKPKTEQKNPAFEKFAEPKTVHEHYVNNLFDAADAFYDTRKDIPLGERADFYDLISSLARDEKVSTVSRNTMIIERAAIPAIDGYLQKMGPEKTIDFLRKYAIEGKIDSDGNIVIPSRISQFTELVTVKQMGLEKEFNEIIIRSLGKAVDEVSAKKSQQVTKDVSSVPATANAAELAASAELNR